VHVYKRDELLSAPSWFCFSNSICVLGYTCKVVCREILLRFRNLCQTALDAGHTERFMATNCTEYTEYN
jgi:hypothetical protein